MIKTKFFGRQFILGGIAILLSLGMLISKIFLNFVKTTVKKNFVREIYSTLFGSMIYL